MKNIASESNAITNSLNKELLDIQEIALVMGFSERTLHRLMQDPMFLRISRRILFQKDKVLQYLNNKYAKTGAESSREKKLRNERKGYYIDCYPPVWNPQAQKFTRQENLKLYTINNPVNSFEKNQNEVRT